MQKFLPLKNQYHQVIQAVQDAGGKPFFVGGCVRDILLGEPIKDVDIEVYGLSHQALKKVLLPLGDVIFVGKSFGVLKIPHLNLDISLPRLDQKADIGHTGFLITTDPTLDFKTATKRRDLTINAMGYDPIENVLLDPYGGMNDLQNKVLKAVDSKTFCEDPLRALRVAGFAARFLMTPDSELISLASQCPLNELSADRIQEEFYKLLVKGKKPSLGFEFLHAAQLLKYFPEIQALQGTLQNPLWHPEGDVWVHTLMVLDIAAKSPVDLSKRFMMMLALLAHDFGKPLVTHQLPDGAWSSRGHEGAGIKPTQVFLKRLNISDTLQKQILCLVKHHLAPILLIKQQAGDGAFRRLARELDHVGLTLMDLAWLARMDHLGRTTEDAIQSLAPTVDAFETRIKQLNLETAPKDVVQGRDLIERGLEPGKHFSEILEKCRKIQDDEGLQDPRVILEKAGI